MKNIYKILLIGLIFASFALARTSGKYEAPESFMRAKISGSTKKAYVPTENENEDNDSIKWKRRHKRRKKDKKRKPSRGR
tara:strand:+ start:250 stop:489 length:240 start_codon:yes stop_codon:yes gene_type:complete